MRLIPTLLVLIFCSAFAFAQTDGAQDPIKQTIASQVEAFQNKDAATAFEFASPFIQGMFGTPENFGAMVRNGYPMVWRPAEFQSVGQEQRGAFTYQKVRIRDAQGVFHTLEYEMVSTNDGWQINGVQFVEAPEVSV